MAVDDHPMLREGISAIIDHQPDMQVIGTAENGRQAVELYSALRPDVTLMDLQMPGMDGVEAIRTIKASHPNARIIVLTTYAGDHRAVTALKAGAAGYLLKSALRTELLDTIREIHAGRRRVLAEVATEIALYSDHEQLSTRELEVLRHVSRGRANKRIAVEMNIVEDTVKAHLKNIFAKLDVVDRTQAVTVAARRGIIDL
nr:response regulator transcription factor [Sphingomonas sp. CARO-RG-8B-R24-01]